MFFHTTAFGDKYSGLTCLALMWFVPTPPERSAIMKVVYGGFGWALKVVKVRNGREIARISRREQRETACTDGLPF